jgi:hypothetical protein
MAFLHWDGLLAGARPPSLAGRIAAELAAPQGKRYRFIAGLAGEIRMRRWRKSASMPVFGGKPEIVPE